MTQMKKKVLTTKSNRDIIIPELRKEMVNMNCRDCVYGYCSDEQGVVLCMADERFPAPCEYDEYDEYDEDEMDELWEEDLDI